MNSPSIPTRCPCGTGRRYVECCGIHHAGLAADSAERLMRSRYSAFVLCDEQYLLATWHPTRRPREIPFDADQVWLGLTILDTKSLGADSAEVEFLARSRFGKSSEIRHHERSRFLRQNGVWFYLDGRITP